MGILWTLDRSNGKLFLLVIFVIVLQIEYCQSTTPASNHINHDDEDAHWHEHDARQIHSTINHKTPKPKDKMAYSEVKSLHFYRNKRTTARRTHSIPQLACVGGTAGCKLFTPDVVQCDVIGHNEDRTIKWDCHADMSEKVYFNHKEIICEGYDYPEDDFFLLGSCGLEFTLDHKDPLDHHEKSYYSHMDEHEREMHQERVKASKKVEPGIQTNSLFGPIFRYLENRYLFLSASIILILLMVCVCLKLRFWPSNQSSLWTKRPDQWASKYGPLTSAVLTTKKAC